VTVNQTPEGFENVTEDKRLPTRLAELMEQARTADPGAALAARRAAVLAERTDPELAGEALRLVAALEPLDPQPRLALARLAAEQGDLSGAVKEAEGVLAEAVDQAARARAAFIIGEIARVQHDHQRAREAYRTALEIEDGLLLADRNDVTAARWYARARGRLAEIEAAAGQLRPARTGAEGALALLRAAAAQAGEPPVLAADIADAEMRLAALELDAGQASSARRRLAEAIGRYEALAVTEPDEPHWRAVLSDAWALAAEADYVRGAPEPARRAMDKALQARIRLAAHYPQEAWALAGTWRLRAALRAALGDADAAAESLRQARALAETLCAQANYAEPASRFLVHTLLDQADHALRTGDLDCAQEAADAARQRAEGFARAKDAAPAAWLAETAACWDRLGEAARAAGAQPQAQEAFSRAVELRRMARGAAPDDPQFARGLAAALIKLGEIALDTGALASARAAFNESASMRLDFMRAAPDDPRAAHALAVALERVGLAAQAAGDRHAARGAWEDELSLADRIFAPDDLAGARFRAPVRAQLAGLGEADAETHRAAALAHFDVLAKAGLLTQHEATLRRKLWGG
jgi:tetratricopeptide (TPR) repeat protein